MSRGRGNRLGWGLQSGGGGGWHGKWEKRVGWGVQGGDGGGTGDRRSGWGWVCRVGPTGDGGNGWSEVYRVEVTRGGGGGGKELGGVAG